MRALIALLFLVMAATPSSATTYTYTSMGTGTIHYPNMPFCPFCSSQTAFRGDVNFGFDTSHFTGTYNLGPGDSASFPASFLYPFAASFSFPGYSGQPGVQGLTDDFSGSFSFEDGAIINWLVTSSLTPANCGIGPGCAYGGSMSLSPTGDSVGSGSYYGTSYSFVGNGGSWAMQAAIAPVPELSTWAMLLIGFVGIGAAAHRRRCAARPWGESI